MLPPLNLKANDERDTDALAVRDSADTESLLLLAAGAFAASEYTRLSADEADRFGQVGFTDDVAAKDFDFFPEGLKSKGDWKHNCEDGQCILSFDHSDMVYKSSLLDHGQIPKFDVSGHWDMPSDAGQLMRDSQGILDNDIWNSYHHETKKPISSWGYVIASYGTWDSATGIPVPGHASLVIESPTLRPGEPTKIGTYGFFPELPTGDFVADMKGQLNDLGKASFGGMTMQFHVGDQSLDAVGNVVKQGPKTGVFRNAGIEIVSRFEVNAALIAVLRAIQRHGTARDAGGYKVAINEIPGFGDVRYNAGAWLAKPMMQLDAWMWWRGQPSLIGNCATTLADVLQNVYGHKIAQFGGGLPVVGFDGRRSMQNAWHTLTHLADRIIAYEEGHIRDWVVRTLKTPLDIKYEDPQLAYAKFVADQRALEARETPEDVTLGRVLSKHLRANPERAQQRGAGYAKTLASGLFSAVTYVAKQVYLEAVIN